MDKTFALEVVRDCEYATLATVNPDGTPYCIPVSVVLVSDDAIYFHCAIEGKKLDNLSKNNAVCLSCVRSTSLVPERFTTQYESAVVTGKCTVVPENDEKIMALRAICEKYAASNMSGFDEKIANSLHRTCVCRIEIENITGKANL